MSGYRVVGLDLSLTSSGISDGHRHFAVQTSDTLPLEPRLAQVRDRVRGFVTDEHGAEPRADLVVIEGPAFSRALQKGHDDLAGLRIMVRLLLWDLGIPFAIVTPSGLKAYTAHGRASKAQMGEAVKERHGVGFNDRSSADYITLKEGREDVVDAFALAAMGYAYLSQPLATEGPPGPLASLLAVDWPKVSAHV